MYYFIIVIYIFYFLLTHVFTLRNWPYDVLNVWDSYRRFLRAEMLKTKSAKINRNFRIVGDSRYTNRELIQSLIMGDPNAAIVFHDRYSTRISRWVWRLLGTDQEHNDIVQQVFVGVFNAFSKIKDAESLDSWVDSVTIKTVRYELRKRKTRRALFLSKTENEFCDSCDPRNPFKQVHIRCFYDILDSMPIDDRIVFVLKYVEGHTLDHIASVGNYSYSTAKRRLKRAEDLFRDKALQDFALISLVEEPHAV